MQICPQSVSVTSDKKAIRVVWPDLPADSNSVEYTAHWLYTHDSTRPEVRMQRQRLLLLDRTPWDADIIQSR